MQHLQVRWLRVFNFSLIGVTALLYLVYILFNQLGVGAETQARWGITPTILILGAVHAIYVIISDRLLIKRFPWIVTMISMVLYAFLNASIIESSGNTNIVYRISYGVLIFFMGVNGPVPIVTALIFTWMILIFTFTGIATPTNASPLFNIVVDTFLTISGFLGWFVFKRWYVVGNTDRKALELKGLLEEEQFKTSALLESITDGVLVVNKNEVVEIANISAATMLGWEKNEVTGLNYKSIFKVSPNESTPVNSTDDSANAITTTLSSGAPSKQVIQVVTHHNRQLYIDMVVSPIHQTVVNKDGSQTKVLTGAIAVLRDVDKQKHQEQQRSDFISTASHEMRTPVASIQGYLELALNPKISTLDEKTKGYVTKAYEATRNLGQLFQDLLNVSKSDDGKLANHPEIVNVNELIGEVVTQEEGSASKKQLRLVFDSAPSQEKGRISPLLYVHADPERLREVIINLVENAIKYTKQGIVTLGAEVKDQSVIIRVSDTGTGIAEEDIPHLFQRFYRVDNSETREIGGTGLGLFITKQIVEMMSGRVWCESQLGAGSTFFVQLPRISPDAISRQGTTKA